MVEVWAMNPTPNSMYMAHQYRLLDCKRGFSANKSRKMVMQMFTISVVFFIFCCKFYTFFYVCMLVHCCAKCEWCSVFCSVMADRQQCLAIRLQRIRNRFAIHFVGVREYIAECSQPISWVYVGILRNVLQSISGCSPRICGMFATCSFSVCYIFALQKYGFWRAKVWFLTCKKGVFELQKYGFCFLNVALLQSVRRVFAECSHIVAICSPRIRNL